MISVILANYNGGQFLSEAIASIINQKYRNFELIIIDDGSTDGSKKIINEFAQRYPDKIKARFQSQNRGQGVSFNIGFAESTGNLICFMDSDDIWFPDKLGNVESYFSSVKSNIALFQHNLFFMRENIITDIKFRDTLVVGNMYKLTQKTKKLPEGFIPTSGLTFPRNILEKILPVPEEFKICADGFLTRTAACYGDIASVSECWGGYRVHSGNNTFENPDHKNAAYVVNLLIPALNKYYLENNLNLKIKNHKLKFKTLSIISFFIPSSLRRFLNTLYSNFKNNF